MAPPDQTRRRPAASDASQGRDPSGSVAVTIGQTYRVRAVRILKVAEVRSPTALAAAFAAAHSAALKGRSSRDERPRTARPRAVAVRPTFRRPGRHDLERHRIRTETPRGERRATPVIAGLSANRCVRVTLDPARSSGTVAADPGWLAQAGPSAISSAITEAFHHAYAERDNQ